MRQVISNDTAADRTVRVTASEQVFVVPDGVQIDHASCASAHAGLRLAASPDGRFVAEVIQSGADGYLIRHSFVELPPVPFKTERGKGAPKILGVSESGVLAWASRPRQTGLFEIGADGIFFRAELDQCDGLVAAEKRIVYGTHPGADGNSRRRFVREGSWNVSDEPLFYDPVTGSWKPVGTIAMALPDGRLMANQRTRKGWECLLVGDGETQRRPLPYAASVRSHLLGGNFVDILNDCQTYRLMFRGSLQAVHGGSVERSWQSPDGTRLLFVEVLSMQHDDEAETLGPQRRLVQLDADGRRTIAKGRICLEANAVNWSPDGRQYAAVVRKLEAMNGPFGIYRDYVYAGIDGGIVLPVTPLTRVTETLVGHEGTMTAFLREENGATKLQARGTDFGPYVYAWNLSRDSASGGVAFNAVLGNAIQRIAIS